VPSRCYLTFLFPTFNCTSKTTGWFTKGAEIDPNLPHANKSVTQGHILIYMDGLLSVASNCAQAVAILPSSIFERSIALVKRLAGSPKELKLMNLPHANKGVTQGSTRILIYMDGLLSVAPNCAQAVAILPSSIFPTFNCTSKTTGWFTKGLKLIPTCPTLTKCYSR
jgi:hypothetical protein